MGTVKAEGRTSRAPAAPAGLVLCLRREVGVAVPKASSQPWGQPGPWSWEPEKANDLSKDTQESSSMRTLGTGL